jgi:hypothetical protein
MLERLLVSLVPDTDTSIVILPLVSSPSSLRLASVGNFYNHVHVDAPPIWMRDFAELSARAHLFDELRKKTGKNPSLDETSMFNRENRQNANRRPWTRMMVVNVWIPLTTAEHSFLALADRRTSKMGLTCLGHPVDPDLYHLSEHGQENHNPTMKW